MAFPDDDPTVQQGDRTMQLIDWLVGRLEECLGEVLPLQTDDLLKDYAKDARNSMASGGEPASETHTIRIVLSQPTAVLSVMADFTH
jgi:hypothetical protein